MGEGSAICRRAAESLRARIEACLERAQREGCRTPGLFATLDASAAVSAAENGCSELHAEALSSLDPSLLSSPQPTLAAFRALAKQRLQGILLPAAIGEWRGHPVEIHVVANEAGKQRTAAIFRVETLYEGTAAKNWKGFVSAADTPTEDDPIGHYNCHSLAFHGREGLIPLAGGCVERALIEPCHHLPVPWPSWVPGNSFFDSAVAFFNHMPSGAPAHITRACNAPADHAREDGYRLINPLEENLLPGDRLIYFRPIPMWDPSPMAEQIRKDHGRILDQFPSYYAVHSAIALFTDDGNITVLQKLDRGEAVVASAFAGSAENGIIFAVARGRGAPTNDIPFSPPSAACSTPNETDAAERRSDPWAVWYAGQRTWAREREKNCDRNPRCR